MKDLPKTMRAAVCKGPGAALEIEVVDVPRPGKGQVLVKLESCGVKWSGKFGQRAKVYPTRTNGYENDKATEFFRQV